jgi:hypothetical protein
MNNPARVIEYKTVSANNATALDKAVNDLLNQGYKLYGSPYLSVQPIAGVIGDFEMYQAMIRDKETSNI